MNSFDLTHKLEKLISNYKDHLPEKMTALKQQWQSIKDNGWENKAWEDFHRQAHNMIGSAGTYGLYHLSLSARELEKELKKYLIVAPPKNEFTLIDQLVENLAITAHHVINEHSSIALVQTKNKTKENNLVYLFHTNAAAINNTVQLLQDLKFQTKTFNTFTALEKAIEKELPGAVICYLNKLNEKEASVLSNKNIPLIYITTLGGFESRLQAIRNGNNAYFIEPFNINALLSRLNQICKVTEKLPYRILIVEDSEEQADYYSLLLQQAGMITLIVNNPLQDFSQKLIEFKPELILMDIYMPNCSGLELATLLRQQETYTSIPIVFLSSEGDKFKQLEAIGLGGDDFITKPVAPEYLILSIQHRAERYRELRNYMHNDGLTGLLNHTQFLIQLENEIKRAYRNHQSFSFAMIDIDKFKLINDRYGHLTGDQVLVSLSHLLQSRLRKTDIIGRYGGEEFAIILTDTPISSAIELLNSIRQTFAELTYETDNQTFQVSFSGGVACFPGYDSTLSLVEAADAALYQAKNQGRNIIAKAKKC